MEILMVQRQPDLLREFRADPATGLRVGLYAHEEQGYEVVCEAHETAVRTLRREDAQALLATRCWCRGCS